MRKSSLRFSRFASSVSFSQRYIDIWKIRSFEPILSNNYHDEHFSPHKHTFQLHQLILRAKFHMFFVILNCMLNCFCVFCCKMWIFFFISHLTHLTHPSSVRKVWKFHAKLVFFEKKTFQVHTKENWNLFPHWKLVDRENENRKWEKMKLT